jgi:hypothetical protein
MIREGLLTLADLWVWALIALGLVMLFVMPGRAR